MTRRKPKHSSSRSSKGRHARSSGRGAGDAGFEAVHQRTVIAQQAARIVIDQGITDYGVAKRKAAQRLGSVSPALLPSNSEVEQAVLEHQRLFGGRAASDLLVTMRKGAVQAMHFFSAYSPRLVGPVLSGAISAHTPVRLLLHTDIAEDVPRRLLEAGIKFNTADATLRYAGDRVRRCPRHDFEADGLTYEVFVLPADAIREAPASPLDGRPERRASIGEVELLARAEAATGSPLSDQ